MMLGPLLVSTQGLSSPEIPGNIGARRTYVVAPVDARDLRVDVRAVELQSWPAGQLREALIAEQLLHDGRSA